MSKYPPQNLRNVHTIVGCLGKQGDPACARCVVNRRVEYMYPEVLEPEARLRQMAKLATLKPASFRLDSLGDLFAPNISDDEAFLVIKHCQALYRHKFVFSTRFPERMHANKPLMQKLLLTTNVHAGVRVSVPEDAERSTLFFEKFVPNRFISFDPVLGDLRSIPVFKPMYAIIAGNDTPGCKPVDQLQLLDLANSLVKRGVRPFIRNIGSSTNSKDVAYIDPGGYNYKFWIKPLQKFRLER